jgi:DNA invertase Pin-like site-specific DNA recombinase
VDGRCTARDAQRDGRRLLFNVLAMVAEFEADLARARTREGMAVAKACRSKQPLADGGDP